MAFLLILIGAILIVTAYRSTMGDLATALEQDVPGFFVWGAAIGAILALGYIPALRTPSRALLVLLAVVIVLTQYQKIAAGISSFRQAAGSSPSGSPTPTPTTGYATSGGPAAPPSQASITGTSSSSPSSSGTGAAGATGAAGTPQAPSPTQALANFDPSAFVQSFTQSIGFGGMA